MAGMTWREVLSGCLLALLLAGCHREPAATTDRSTPQAAVASLMHAIDQRDASAVADAFVRGDPAEQAYIAALAEVLAASQDLRQKATARFGSEDARQLVGDGGPGEDDFRRFSEAAVDVQGDQATLRAVNGETLHLRKVEGQWKVVAAADRPGQGDAPLRQATSALTRLGSALRSAADGIASGQLTTVDEARLVIARSGLAAPATQPMDEG